MTAPDASPLDQVREVADAILYEGYLLYPYRASAQKNQQRFQFGVLMPPGYADPSERRALQAECVLECPDDAPVRMLIRFLQLRLQAGRAEGAAPWYEAVEHERLVVLPAGALLDRTAQTDFHVEGEGGGNEEPERVRWELDGVLHTRLTRLPGPYGALRLHIQVQNRTITEAIEQDHRDEALRHALVAAHVVVQVPGGRFLSMTDPPQWASGYVAECANDGVWPVLAAPRDGADLLLVSPIILYDHPQVAAESPGALYDSTEIDEILLLRTLALTDAEKSEARATDPRAAAVIDQTDALSPEIMDRLHGAIRYLKAATGPDQTAAEASQAPPGPPFDSRVPWWDPGMDASVSPETDHVVVDGVRVARGSKVVMRPGTRRADAQDLFLTGRPALVEAVLYDVDGHVHLAVSPLDDPDADLRGLHGRFLYFAPDEVEPVAEPDRGPRVEAAP